MNIDRISSHMLVGEGEGNVSVLYSVSRKQVVIYYASIKAFIFSGRLISTLATKGSGYVRLKYSCEWRGGAIVEEIGRSLGSNSLAF